MNLQKELRSAIGTGKVEFGEKKIIESAKTQSGKLIIITNNCPYKDQLTNYKENFETKIYEFEGTSADLSALCKQPYPISALVILDAGESQILELK